MTDKNRSFFSGAFVLMISSILVRVIGAFFKVPLSAMLGGEGMGYYMTAYTVIGPAFALSVMGFSISVSKLCSAAYRNNADRKMIFSTALIVFSLIGLILAMIIYAGAPVFSEIVGNKAALKAVRAMAPAIVFCCISSVFRGYYEGMGYMIPTAASQVAEAFAKLGFGLLLSWLSINKAVEEFNLFGTVTGVAAESFAEAMAIAAPNAAAAAVAGVSISTAVGCAVAVGFYIKDTDISGKNTDKAMTFTAASSALIKTAMPVSAAALVINLASMMDILSVMNIIGTAAAENWDMLCQSRPELILAEIEPARAANYLYGTYTGLSMTIFNLAPAFTSSIGICALPMISSLYAKGRKKLLRSRIESILRITLIVAIPIGMGMSTMAVPIINTIFPKSEYEAVVAAELLKTLGIASIFVAVSGVVNSMLQAIGRIYVPLKLLICGAVIKLAVNWLLISIPSVNISGAPWGTLCCYLFIMVAGTTVLIRSTNADIRLLSLMVRPALAALICCTASKTSMIFL